MIAVLSGGTGYLGGRLINRLTDDGYTIVLVTRSPESVPPSGSIEAVDANRPTAELAARLSAVEADLYFHLASATPTGDVAHFEELLDAAVRVGVAMLEAASHGNPKPAPVLAAGSFWQRSVFGGTVAPNCLYAASKDAFAAYGNYYAVARQVPVALLDIADIYGPADSRGRIISTLVASLGSLKRPSMSPGEQIVSFVHVDDVVNAFMALAKSMDAPGGLRHYGVAGPTVGTLRSEIERVESLLGIDFRIEWGALDYRQDQVMEFELPAPPPNWIPKVRIEDGVRSLLEGFA